MTEYRLFVVWLDSDGLSSCVMPCADGATVSQILGRVRAAEGTDPTFHGTREDADRRAEEIRGGHTHGMWNHPDDFDGPDDYAGACQACPVCS